MKFVTLPSWSRCRRRFAAVAVICAILFVAPLARAHDPGLSVVTAGLEQGSVWVHLAMARTDAERLVPIDANHDGKISDAEFQAALPSLEREAREAFEVTCADRTLAVDSTKVRRDDKDGVHFYVSFAGVTGGQLTIRSLMLDELPRGHRQYLAFENADKKRLGEKMLDVSDDSLTLQLEAQTAPVTGGHSFREFFTLGVEHILTGYDHLLFLSGLLLVGGGLRSALKIITSFTLAHSITLALATLNVINIPPRIIEPMIAASIVFVGLENIFRPDTKNRWLVTFAFGLIHGCGFASALRDLGIGSNGTSVVVPLVSFNLGVEAGQLAVASIVLPIIWKCRASPRFVARWVPAGSVAIVLLGGYWFLQRTMF